MVGHTQKKQSQIAPTKKIESRPMEDSFPTENMEEMKSPNNFNAQKSMNFNKHNKKSLIGKSNEMKKSSKNSNPYDNYNYGYASQINKKKGEAQRDLHHNNTADQKRAAKKNVPFKNFVQSFANKSQKQFKESQNFSPVKSQSYKRSITGKYYIDIYGLVMRSINRPNSLNSLLI